MNNLKYLSVDELRANLLSVNNISIDDTAKICQLRLGGTNFLVSTTLVTFNWTISDIINPNYFINNGTNITILKNGYYRVKGYATLEAINNSANLTMFLDKNGILAPSFAVSGNVKGNISQINDFYSVNATYIFNCVAGDLISCKCISQSNIIIITNASVFFIEYLGNQF